MQGLGMSAQQKLQQQRSKPKRLVSLRRDDIVSVDVKEKTLVLRDGLTIKLRGEDVARCIPGCPAFGVPFDDASSVYRKDGVVKALRLPPGCGTRCAEASIPDSAFRSLVSRRNSMLRGLKPDGFMPWYVVSATLVEYSGTAVNWAEEVALRMMEALAALKDGAKKLKFEAEILNMVNLKAEEEEARAAAELVVPGGEQLQLPEGVLPVDGTAGLGEAGAVGGELEIEGGVGTYKKEVVVVREVEAVGEAGLRVVGGIVGSASGEGNAVGAVVEGNAVVGGLGIGGKGGEDAALTAGAMLLLSEREGTGAGVEAAGSGLPLRKEEGGSEWREVCVQDKCKLNRHDLTQVVVELACGPASPAVQVGGVVEGRQLRSREIKTTVVEKLPTRSVAKAAAQVLAKAFSEMDTRCRKNEEQCKQLEVDGSERQVEKGVSEQEGAEAKAKAEADALAKAEADALAKAEDDALAKAEADALARAEADALAKAEADALARAEADALAKAEADALAKAEANALAKAEANALAKAEAEALAKAEAEAKARARAEAEAKAKAKAESEAFNALMQAEEENLAKAREEKNGLLRRFNMIGARAAVAEQEKRGVIRQIIECSAAGRKLMADRDNVLAEIMKDMKATQEARLVKVAQMHVKRRKLEEVKASYEEITKSHTSQIWELEKAVVDQGYGVESMHKQWQEHSHKVEEHKRSEAKLEVSLAKAEEALAVLEEEKNKLVVELQEQHARMKLLRSKFMPEDDIPDVLDINTIEIEALLLAADERDMEPFAGNNKRKHPDTDRDFRRRPQETERDVGGLRQRARTSENGGGKRALRGSSAVV